jgi:CSLREA domain-containing protein
MQYPRVLPFLLPLLVLAACGEDQPPTSPIPTDGLGGPAFSHTAGHKVVNSVTDPGNGICNATQCTLREAINDPQSTEISFAPGLTGPITLISLEAGGGPLRINKTLSITGPSTRIAIRRRSTDPAFRIFQIFNPTAAPTVTLTNLIIRGGESNIEPFGGLGGGIDNQGTLRLVHCVVTGNSGDGGGIFNFEAALTLVDSRVSNNSGGGIENAGTTAVLTLIHSTVSGNSASEDQGGGIINQVGAVTLINSTVSANTGRFGGGILNNSGGITINNSTISDNSASEGGGVFNFEGRVNLTNSTVSSNSANSGGGLVNHGTPARMKLRNTTIARNSASLEGGGIKTSGPLTLVNSLVALNTAPQGPDVLKSGGLTAPVTARFSLLGIGSGSSVKDGENDNQVGNRTNPLDPLVGPLANNGGPTRTHALLLGSPAIDAASTPGCPPTDQRGVLRPQGTACDIGSYERR